MNMPLLFKPYVKKIIRRKMIVSVVEVDGLNALLDERRNVAFSDGKELYDWWTGQFYVNEEPEAMKEYEFLGEKVNMRMMVLNEKMLDCLEGLMHLK
jgi:hypothetical protein